MIKEDIVKALTVIAVVVLLMVNVRPSSQLSPRVMVHSTLAPTAPEVASPAPAMTGAEVAETLNLFYAAENTRYPLSSEERDQIERIVASEGGYCGYEFQALVAQCILNGCEADGLRPLELFERGDFWLVNDVAPDEVTKQAVSDVFDKGIFPTTEKIRWYYNPNYCDCQRQSEIVRKRRRNYVVFRREWDNKIKRFLAQIGYLQFAVSGA